VRGVISTGPTDWPRGHAHCRAAVVHTKGNISLKAAGRSQCWSRQRAECEAVPDRRFAANAPATNENRAAAEANTGR
jgi:hypothetical protein